MKKKEQDYKAENKNYLVMASTIILVFILLLTMVNLEYFIPQKDQNSDLRIKNISGNLDESKQAVLNPSCIVVTGKDKGSSMEIVEASLEKARISFNSKETFEDITGSELKEADIMIVNGRAFNTLGSVDILKRYMESGKHIIFTSMPDVDYIYKNGLDKIMGIKNITQSGYQEGVKFLQGFLIGGLLELSKLDYEASRVQLISTTKTYVTGEEDSAVIWRNTYNGNEIYVVNGSFFETNAGYGILCAIMSQINTDYIYPVINAKVLTYTGLPYIGDGNTGKLKNMYNRNAMMVQRDILIPDILSINRNRNFIPSVFLADSFDKDEANNYSKNQITGFKNDIYKLGQDVGMVYSGNLERDNEIYHNLFGDKNFKAIRIEQENMQFLDKLLNDDKDNLIESVLGPWKTGMKNFGYVKESTVYIPITIDGAADTDQEILEFYSGVTAFGAIIQNLDLQRVIFPEDNLDNWMYVYRNYVKSIDSYREKFKMIEARSFSDAAKAVEKFNSNSPTIQYADNKIHISFEKWYGESYYILRTDKKIHEIIGGTYEKIEDGVYLVTVKNREVDIKLRKINQYG